MSGNDSSRVEAALSRAESPSGAINEGDAGVLAAEVRRLGKENARIDEMLGASCAVVDKQLVATVDRYLTSTLAPDPARADPPPGVAQALAEVARVCKRGAPEYPWHVAELLAAEVRRLTALLASAETRVASKETLREMAVRDIARVEALVQELYNGDERPITPYNAAARIEAALYDRPAPTDERRAPVQASKPEANHPGTVAWEEHEHAWEAYAQQFGRTQSAERIAERGGFSYYELKLFLGRAPTTWKPAKR